MAERWAWWDNDRNVFKSYNAIDSSTIETGFQQNLPSVSLGGGRYLIQLTGNKCQLNTQTSFSRPIRRETWFWQGNHLFGFSEEDGTKLENEFCSPNPFPKTVNLGHQTNVTMTGPSQMWFYRQFSQPCPVSRGYPPSGFIPVSGAPPQNQIQNPMPTPVVQIAPTTKTNFPTWTVEEQQLITRILNSPTNFQEHVGRNCGYGICCINLSTEHRTHYCHPTTITFQNSGVLLTREDDKSSLKINVLNDLPNPHRWLSSPSTRVTVAGQDGICRGWEMATSTSKSGKILVQLSETEGITKALEISQVVLNQVEPFNAPWYNKRSLIFRSEHAQQTFDVLLTAQVDGLPPSTTFSTVFQEIGNNGHPVFIIGGAVRDVVQGKQIQDIKDIDISFGCSANEVRAIATAKGWKCNIFPSGLIILGNENSVFHIEGKAIGCHSFDISLHRTNESTSGLGSIGVDLSYEVLYRDFTINALCYDPFNKVIIDPTSFGVEDCVNMKLRLPCTKNMWWMWARGNPLKLLRYWKFVARGFSVINSDTKSYITILAKKSDLVKVEHWKMFLNGLKKTGSPEAVKLWRDAVEADLGAEYVKQMLG